MATRAGVELRGVDDDGPCESHDEIEIAASDRHFGKDAGGDVLPLTNLSDSL
jgi:hypothetical protein